MTRRESVRGFALRWTWLAAAACLLAGPTAPADTDAHEHWQLHQPESIEWREGPASLPPGAEVAVLEGDPAKEDFFTIRLKMPDGFRVAPHWHPKTERITVIAGVLNLGMGDTFDPESKSVLKLGAGSYSSMPAKMTHFGWMTGETILQLSSLGPWEVVYVNPADDPRLAR